jgi:hypothetical protein
MKFARHVEGVEVNGQISVAGIASGNYAVGQEHFAEVMAP